MSIGLLYMLYKIYWCRLKRRVTGIDCSFHHLRPRSPRSWLNPLPCSQWWPDSRTTFTRKTTICVGVVGWSMPSILAQTSTLHNVNNSIKRGNLQYTILFPSLHLIPQHFLTSIFDDNLFLWFYILQRIFTCDATTFLYKLKTTLEKKWNFPT